MLYFVEGRKLENPEKNPQGYQQTNNNKLNWPAHRTGPESNQGHIAPHDYIMEDWQIT